MRTFAAFRTFVTFADFAQFRHFVTFMTVRLPRTRLWPSGFPGPVFGPSGFPEVLLVRQASRRCYWCTRGVQELVYHAVCRSWCTRVVQELVYPGGGVPGRWYPGRAVPGPCTTLPRLPCCTLARCTPLMSRVCTPPSCGKRVFWPSVRSKRGCPRRNNILLAQNPRGYLGIKGLFGHTIVVSRVPLH